METKTGKTMNDSRDFDVSWVQDSMFQLHVARRVMRRAELLFEMTRGNDKKGFVIGLDEYFIQIVSIEDLKISWVSRDQLISFSETGVVLSDFKKEDDLESVTRVQILMRGFRNKCIKTLNDKGLLHRFNQVEENTSSTEDENTDDENTDDESVEVEDQEEEALNYTFQLN